MRSLSLIFVFVIMINPAFSQDKGLLLDDFEGVISGGPEGRVDFGAGGGSSIEVTADTAVKYSGNQSIKVSFDAVSGGYMWLARGSGLDAKDAEWLVRPQDIDWAKYNAFSFYMYGSDSKAQIVFDIKDSGNEIWRFMAEDNFQGWKQITCPFNEFFARSDWQPDSADKNTNLRPLQNLLKRGFSQIARRWSQILPTINLRLSALDLRISALRKAFSMVSI